ncbi:MAG: 2-oxoacid:acceptor oxidoreductase family protein [Anaerolineales bacterium]|nr:2-oxoacid:acceptor oxidoreductase family protein [Anaerolineales bacterium]
MQIEFILSGFGGQGALLAGTVLAQAGLDSGKNVTWLPSYGPEMRGGTAHVTVIIGDEEIGSPVVRCPRAVLVLNNPSLEKYEPLVQPGGVLVYNSSLIAPSFRRADIHYVAVPASDIGTELGDIKVANMVALGALVAITHVVPLAAVKQALSQHLSQSKRELLAADEQALQRGAQCTEPDQYQ